MDTREHTKKLANDIRTKIYGKEVREALATGIEESGDTSQEARDITENLLDGSYDTGLLNTEIEQRMNNLYSTKGQAMDDLYTQKNTELTDLYINEKSELDNLQADYANRAEVLETTYAPRLTTAEQDISNNHQEVTAQLAKKASKEEVESLLGNISNATPVFVSSIEEMTDIDRIYVYTENGEVYAHDGSSFISTGVQYTESGVSNHSINRLKIDFGGYVPKGFEFTRDALKNRARASNLFLSKGEIVQSEGFIDIFLLKKEGAGAVDYSSSWEKERTIEETGEFIIRVRKPDESDFTLNEIALLTNKISVINEKTAIQRREINDILTSPSFIYKNASNPIREVSENLRIEKGATVTTENTPFEFAIYNEEGEEFYNGWGNKFVVPTTDFYNVLVRKRDNSIISADDLDLLKDSLKVYKQNDFVQFKDLKVTGTDLKRFYVSPEGSDSNNGLTEITPFKTIQKAIDFGAETIYVASGDYLEQTINANSLKKLEIIVVPTSDNTHTARILNGREINVVYSNGKYSGNLTLDSQDQWREVFIDKTLPPENTGAYQTNWKMKTYNAILWQIDETNDGRTIKLEPVLSMDEMNQKEGSFFYDGTNVYIHPTFDNSNLKFVKTINNTLTPPTFKNIENLTVNNLEFLYHHKGGVQVENVSNYYFLNCTFSFTSEGTAFVPRDSSGKSVRCHAYHNQQDGFGPVLTGNSDFIDCYGYYNGDDGVSHHQYTTGTIRGGEYHHNMKGGVIPTHHTKVDVYNVFSHNNRFGFSFREGHGQSSLHNGNVAYDNEYDIQVSGYKVKAYNCKYETQEVLDDNHTELKIL